MCKGKHSDDLNKGMVKLDSSMGVEYEDGWLTFYGSNALMAFIYQLVQLHDRMSDLKEDKDGINQES